jgi:hypothetical protein
MLKFISTVKQSPVFKNKALGSSIKQEFVIFYYRFNHLNFLYVKLNKMELSQTRHDRRNISYSVFLQS